MKKFDNVADDGKEKAFRRGATVPPGAVNVAWVKSPTLSPENNTIIVDTSSVAGDNANAAVKQQKLAFGNFSGMLEDEHGNQIWGEEYPIISDVFLPPEGPNYGDNFVDEDVLPYLHVSRHFHVDYAGLTISQLDEYDSPEIKVVDKNGVPYNDADGNRRYKVYIFPVEAEFPEVTMDAAYRLYIFLDMNPGIDELYVKYNKIEIDSNGDIKNQQIDYQEQINPRSYFRYVPEESDVIDHANVNQKIFSTKPVNVKQKLLGLPQNDYQGWNIYTPRKAIPDPRIFQLFRWRVACEFSQPTSGDVDTDDDFISGSIIKAGVIVPKDGDYLTTRANYFFYQMANSDYNYSGIQFVNPLKSNDYSTVTVAQQADASYWHVDIDKVTPDELYQFDVLIWAPTATSLDVSPYIQKINHFVDNVGGTFIYESSGITATTGFSGITFSPPVTNMTAVNSNAVEVATMRMYDATPDNPNDTFSSYGKWKEWPPNIRDIITQYNDTGSILTDASQIAGWNMTSAERSDITGYNEIPAARMQYMTTDAAQWKRVTEARRYADLVYRPTMVHKKYLSGGNLFVSTGCFFEDHLFEPSGDLIMRTMGVSSFNSLANAWRLIFNNITSSNVMAGEMKLRYNTIMLATVFKPAPQNPSVMWDYNNDYRSNVVYTDWFSSWVINPLDDVLSEEEIQEFNFMLKTTKPTDLEPIWQRVLSNKTYKQLIQDKIKQLDPQGTNPMFQTAAGTTKRYYMVVTNPSVETVDTEFITEDAFPSAWTNAYSPKFVVPYWLGPYDVRDEMIAGTGVGDGKRIYPAKPFSAQVDASYITTSSQTAKFVSEFEITATVTRLLTQKNPPVEKQVWIPGLTVSKQVLRDTVLRWNTNGYGYQHSATRRHQRPWKLAVGIDAYTDANYRRHTEYNNWPYWGHYGLYSHTSGRHGSETLMIQKALNLFISEGIFSGPWVRENGIYNNATAARVKDYQADRGTAWVDGKVDAQTWSLIGYSLAGLAQQPGYLQSMRNNVMYPWLLEASQWMDVRRISDGVTTNGVMRQSWYVNGPPSISQTFHVSFNPNDRFCEPGRGFRIYQVNILPWGNGQRLTYMDINNRNELSNYDHSRGWPGQLQGLSANDNTWIQVPLKGERYGMGVSFTLSSNLALGIGSTRRLGVRDVAVYARRLMTETSTTPGRYETQLVSPGTVRTIEQKNTFTAKIKFEFVAGVPKNFNPLDRFIPEITALVNSAVKSYDSVTVGSIKWNINSLKFTNPSHADYFDVAIKEYTNSPNRWGWGTAVKRNELLMTFNGFGLVNSNSYKPGVTLGNGITEFYTKNTSGVIDPYPQKYGWVSKDDGIKLLCQQNGLPIRFVPSTFAANNGNIDMHFVNILLSNVDFTDQTVYVGFYDNNRKEWIVNNAGDAQLSYYDWIRRGPNNVFVGAMTTYEIDTNSNLPARTDGIMRPFKWAMPVYGVTTNSNSKIRIEPLHPNLASTDVWALPVKAGSFSTSIKLRPKADGSYVGRMADYQGSTVNAHYAIPESENGPWSQLYGRPYVDVIDEIPIVWDDNAIKVRQAPILTVQEPTATPSLADPWVPVFQVSVRQDLNSPWVNLPLTAIKDYDLVNGIITLRDDLPGNDARLVKITYTSENQVYQFKHDGINKVNLNPYINDRADLRDKPIYVYIVPEYVSDANNNLISGTTQTRTLKITTDPSIFSPVQVNYDPLALMLGVVYITTAFSMDDLSILDTRSRGGGASVAYEDAELIEIEPEADGYWDISPPRATSFQNGGFLIIRLPKEVASFFSKDYVVEVIERNIAGGIAYKLETLEGEMLEWTNNQATPNGVFG